jgi:isopentenyl phosphate kinase
MLTLVKLGGSLLTDKAKSEALRNDELTRIAHEIQRAVNANAERPAQSRAQLIIAHGSGSFGHVPARQYETHLGRAARPDTWRRGMALVARAAAKLNGFVVNALVECDLNVLALPPRALRCDDGRVIHESARDFADAVRLALDSQLLPLLNGDVVGDTVRGCTILSTEALFAALLMHWRSGGAAWILCAGETNGVLRADGSTVREITAASFGELECLTDRSAGADVTGAMRGKVMWLLECVERFAPLQALIFNALVPGALEQAMLDPLSVQNATIVRLQR